MLPVSVIETIVRYGRISEFEHLFDSQDEKQISRLKDKSIAWVVADEAWRLTPYPLLPEPQQWSLQKSGIESRQWAEVAIVNEACYLAFEALWVADEERAYDEEILSRVRQNEIAEAEFRSAVQRKWRAPAR